MDQHLAKERYVSLTTYRRNGDPVSNPMWIAPFDGELYMVTDAASAKVKRLRADPTIEVVASDMRGRTSEAAKTYRGTAELLDDEGTALARRAYERKYGPLAYLMGTYSWVQRTILRRDVRRVGIRIALED